jgi:hypothetical protein
MTSSASFRRFVFAFGTTFAILYVVALARDIALFTVFPALGVVLAGTHHTRDVADPAMGFLAPAIYWYGWAATAALGALTFGLVAALLPGRWTRAIWRGWGVVSSRALDDRVRLSHTSLVSVLTRRFRSRRSKCCSRAEVLRGLQPPPSCLRFWRIS